MARGADIDITELESRLDDGARLIDVRESDEYTSGHVPGAESWPLSELSETYKSLGSAESLVLICQSGGRSSRACDFLDQQGYPVTNVSGGTMAWVMSGRDVVVGVDPK
ncbi:MAG: rhodanese-like domain-containing protein [Actinomycetota bacterium]